MKRRSLRVMTRDPLRSMPQSVTETHFWTPRVLVPFLLVSLIWGSTWLVIRDQIAVVPPSWSITYRFIVGAAAMFVLVRARGLPFSLGRDGQILAILLGVSQFICNFNFVYRAEHFITSGLVAVIFALLIIPNALLSAVFLGQRIATAFIIGSLVAIAGVAALFANEYNMGDFAGNGFWSGIGFALLGVLSASVANVMQGSRAVQRWPIISMLAWAMLWGAIGNAAIAFAISGPPVIEPRFTYWLGIFYLGIVASAVTFPLYFGLIRVIGPGRAAYSSVIVPITAMMLSTIFEDYRWTNLAIVGAALGLVGLLIAMWARTPRTPRLPG